MSTSFEDVRLHMQRAERELQAAMTDISCIEIDATTTRLGDAAEGGEATRHENTCATCRWFRVKSESGGTHNRVRGACDSPEVACTVHAYAIPHAEIEDVRFDSDFGCRFWEERRR